MVRVFLVAEWKMIKLFRMRRVKKQVNILQWLHLLRLCLLCANAHIIPNYSKCTYQYSLDLTIIFLHLEFLHWSPWFVTDCRILLSCGKSLTNNLNFSQPSQVPSLWWFSANRKLPFMQGTGLAESSALLFPWKMYFS